MTRRVIRTLGAVLLGVVFIIAVTTLVDIALHAAGVYSPWSMPIDNRQSLIATSYRFVISVAGAYLTAALVLPQCWLGGRWYVVRNGRS